MKKRQNISKLLSILIAITLLSSVFFIGCSVNVDKDSSSTSDKSTSDKSTTNNAAKDETKKDPGIVKILTVDSGNVQKNFDQDLPVIKQIEENLNIKLKWELVPNTGIEEALQIRLAAGSGMPEIFMSWQQVPEILAKNNAVISFSDYFNTTMKNVKKILDNDASLKGSVTSPDGNVYFLPIKGLASNIGWLIRQDWLDKLNMQVPETIDDLQNVLIAFRDNDMNENDKKDEIPMAFRHIAYTYQYMMQSWGLNIAQPWDWVGTDNKGTIYTYVTKPEFKECISYLKDLYANKLINQDVLSVSTQSYQQIINDNRVGIIFDSMGSRYLDSIKELYPDTDPKWTVMLPVKGPKGDRGIRSHSTLDGMTFISKGGNVEDATRFIDYVFGDPEGTELIYWGIEGLTYTKENGVINYTDYVINNPDGLTPGEVLQSVGCRPTLCRINQSEPKSMLEATYKEHPWIPAGIELYKSHGLNNFPEKRYRFTTDEAAQIKEVKDKLDTYINENLAKFLVGDKPMSEYDSFAKTLQEKGIDKIAEVYQAVEDRNK